MDKITRQVRIEHWTQIMNECLNSGMNKTEWCRANGISDKQFFYWQRILRKEAFAASTSKDLSVITDPADETSPQKISFAEISIPIKQESVRFMLNDASGFRRIYLATGYTDLRRGMEGLASIIKFNFQLDPYQKDILFLFCGRRTDRIKGLVWEGDGFLLLYKRLELGAFNWPRTKEEALEITPEQYQYLMQGLEIVARHPIQEVRPDKIL